MVTALCLENFGLTHGTEYDWSAQLFPDLLSESLFAASRAVPCFSALKADGSVTLWTVELEILHGLALHAPATTWLDTEAGHHVYTVRTELLELCD